MIFLKYCNIYVKWPHSCSITLDFWILTTEKQKWVSVSLQNLTGHTHLFWTSRIFKFFFIKQLRYCSQLCRTVEQQWKTMHEKHSSDQFKYRSIQISLKKGSSFQNLHAQQSQAYTCVKEKHYPSVHSKFARNFNKTLMLIMVNVHDVYKINNGEHMESL